MKDPKILSLNGTDYEFQIKLSNSGGSIILPRPMFVEMKIEESFIDWAFRGYITYDNSEEQFERFKVNAKVKNSEPFYFRRDGTDVVDILLKPIMKQEGSRSNSTKRFEKSKNIEKAHLTLKAVIYDTEDMSDSDINDKLKKLYFHDINYQKALTLDTRVSCGEYLAKDGDVKTKNNAERTVLNGDLIKYICQDKLGADIGQWDSGSRKSYYISPPNRTVSEDMDYLLSGYIDDDKYPCYFSWNRITDKFELLSYKTLFKRYMDRERENMKFTDPSIVTKGVFPPRTDSANAYYHKGSGDIRSYKYSKMSPISNAQSIVSRVVSGYNDLDGKFIRNATTGGIEVVRKDYEALFEDFPSEIKEPLFVINNDKIENKNAIEYHVLEPSCGCAKTIRAGVIYNDAIQIRSLGFVSRYPGLFIDITSETDTQGIWEDIFLGSWLMLNVTHTVTPTTYTNDILAVKPNMSSTFKYPTDDSLHKGVS